MVSKGSEPVILGFKRQIILSQGRGGEAPLVVSVANAPGLPPVVGVTLLSGDSDLGSLSIPEGYEVLEPNLIDVLRESDTLRNAFGLPPIASLAGDEDGAVHESLNALAFNPRSLYLAVKRQVEASMSRDLDVRAIAVFVHMFMRLSLSVYLSCLSTLRMMHWRKRNVMMSCCWIVVFA